MPALAPYIPARNANLRAWLQNFSTLIAAGPASYGLLASDSTNITNAYNAFLSAYTPITSPATKTAAAVSTFNTAKVAALFIIRPYAQAISLNPGVGSAAKIALGLNPRTSTPSKIAAPTSAPVLTTQSGAHLTVVMRYRDSAASPSVKAKPYGVLGCEIWFATSATPITLVSALTSMVNATKSPVVIQFPPSAGGLQAYFAARWRTRTGLYSPWSPIIGFTVPVGS